MPKITVRREMWFPVPEAQAPGRVLIREVTAGEREEAILKATRIDHLYTAQGVQTKRGTALGEAEDIAMCLAIKDWEEFTDADGKPMECTDAAKLAFAREDWFRPFIVECREKAAAEWQKITEAAKGN
jgi:hypothetical protein